jgi:arylsulfatase
MRSLFVTGTTSRTGALALVLLALGPGAAAQDVLPLPPDPFEGKIGLSVHDSEPDFPKGVQAPEGAPNVFLVMLDDVGFGAASAFGGPCNTPTLERLAENGLRYNQFHTTALCSPTRAALLTGRNHHSAHTACIMEAGTGFPGYDTLMQKDTATMAEVLKQTGWNTAWFGKNHNVPDWMTSQAGPFDLWPVGLGFEKFYGFIGGDTNQWRAAVTDGTKPVDPYLDDPDYNFDDDLADQAIAWVRSQKVVAPDKPFFLYYVPGATHAPHHPRKEWVDKYEGAFDKGWDAVREETYARQKQLGVIPSDCELTPRHDVIPAWDTRSPEEQKLYARFMEVYAGYLEQTDHNVGRVLDAIEELGQLENTLVVYIVGDNGASAEGSLQGLANEMTFFNGVKEDLQTLLDEIDEIGTWKTYNHYPVGWAHAMCTPFQWTKQIASHYGGTRNAMVVSWPAGIPARGELRTQWHHVIDVAPTVLEACGVRMPAVVNGVTQKPIEGTSFAYSFEDAKVASRRTKQYFEMLGNRAIYHDGWVACTTPPVAPWDPSGAAVDPITGYDWELYHVDEDFSQARDLAAEEPERLALMQTLFYAEAAKYDVLPIDNSKTARLDPAIRPSLTRGRESFTFYDGQTRIPEGALPDVKNKSWRVTAKVTSKGPADEGMLVTQGGLFGGWALLVQGGKPAFHYNFIGLETTSAVGTEPLAAGEHTLVVDFRYDSPPGARFRTAAPSAAPASCSRMVSARVVFSS